MTLPIRVIPCLDVANGRVVKGVNFSNLVDSGDPVELATRYYREGADELTFLDVTASVENRSAMLDIVSATAEAVFIPLTVGGGITSTDDVAKLLEAGADKVSLGSAGVRRPELLAEIATKFGSQVLVVSLDIKRDSRVISGYTVTTHGGRNETGIDAMEWISQVQNLGAGELLVNSIDADGTKSGFDLELLIEVVSGAKVPVIASGGAGTLADFLDAAESGVDAVLAASVFHNQELSIREVKNFLGSRGVTVRTPA